MVSNARDDFPEPLTPVMMISLPAGSVTSMFFRLWVRAPRTTSGLRAFCGLVASGIPTVANSPGPLKGESYYTRSEPRHQQGRLLRLWAIGLPARLQLRKGARVLDNRPAQCDEQTGNRHDTPDVEQLRPSKWAKADVRIAAQGDRADRQHDSQLCWAHARKRHAEHAAHGGREKHFARYEQVRDEQRQRDHRRHESRTRQAGHQKRDPDDIEDVIDVEAIARPLDTPDPRQRAVKTVAEPVEGQARDDDPEPVGVPARQPEAEPGERYRREREYGQVVGMDRRRQVAGDTDQQTLLGGSQQTAVFTHVFRFRHGNFPRPVMCTSAGKGLTPDYHQTRAGIRDHLDARQRFR